MALSETLTAKSVAMCVLFCTSVILGTIPITLPKLLKWKKSNNMAKNNICVQILLCFGGGVLLCTTFLHILPEVTEKITKLPDIPQNVHYAELLMCSGFFMMYFIEEIVHLYLHIRQKRHPIRKSLSIRRGSGEIKEGHPEDYLEQGAKSCSENEEHHHSHFSTDIDDSAVKIIRGLLIVLALSVHELFEGLAVGLETSSKNVWYLFGAVSAHKLVIAFCIGVELVTSGMKTIFVVTYVVTFAIVSPLGIGAGIIVSGKDESLTTLPSIILQGIASGTLLYVVFFEILSTERKAGIRQFFAVFIGFLFMLGITFLE